MKNNILNFLLFLFVFLATFTHPWDLDLGWHLRFGRDIVENHTFPYTNTYSSELPGYRWFNSSWAMDILKYILFNQFGFFGYALLGSLTIIVMFYMAQKVYRLTILESTTLFSLLLYVENSIFTQNFRGQTISLLFLIVLYSILWKYQCGHKKIIILLIPLFFLWANLHAQFILGLGITILWFAIFIFQNRKTYPKKQVTYIILTLIIAISTTLINPYNIDLYIASLEHVNSPPLRYVTEFESPEIWSPNWVKLVLWGLALVSSIFILIRQKRVKEFLPYIAIGFLTYALSFTSRRFMWSMYAITIPLIVIFIQSILFFPKSIQRHISLIFLTVGIVYLLIFQIPQRNILKMNWESYCLIEKIGFCSPQAAESLTRMKKIGKLFSHYNYGGWLIWNYPKVKPGIDGRMPQWVDKNGYSPFRKFILTSNLNAYQLEISPYDTYFIPSESPIKKELDKLTQINPQWKKIYSDTVTSIYSRL